MSKRGVILILFTDLFGIGGLQAYNRHLCDALEVEFTKDNFFAISLCDIYKGNLNQWRNIKLVLCGYKYPKFVQKILLSLKAILISFIKRPDFLICAHVNLSPIALLFKKFYGLKYAVLTQGIDVWNLKHGIRYNGLKNAEVIIAVSKYTKDRMVRNDICEEKIKLLHHAVDASLFYKKTPERDLLYKLALVNKRILLSVGRLSLRERYKGHDIMLEALQRLGNEYVWLVVGGGDDLPRLKQKAQDIGVVEKARFLGEIENDKLIDYYNLCDCFVMPSKGEGFGIVFLEALACGKPVIAGNKDGSAEPLMDGILGFLVDPDDVDEIIKAIKYACTAKEDRTNPEYLIKQVRENFGIEVFNKRVREIFSPVIASER